MGSVAKRYEKPVAPTQPDLKPDPEFVKTNQQRFQWESAVLRCTSRLTDRATGIAFYLSKSWREKLGYCFPPIESIAADLGISETTTWRSLQCLSRLGLIVIKKGKRRGAKHSHSIYYLTLQSGPLFQRNSLKNREIDMAELPTSHYANQNSGESANSDIEVGSDAERGKNPATIQICIPTTMQIRIDNHSMELQGEPHGSPPDSDNNLKIVTREDDAPVDDSGALEARPDAAFRAQLEPHHLAFYDQLAALDQYRYRKLDADRRDEFAIAWDFQHGGDDHD